MKAPKFFYKKSIMPIFLSPLSYVFALAGKVRNFLIKPQKLDNKFVICLGNATVGGGGKTPSAIMVAKVLKEEGLSVCFLSRGYGRKSRGFMKATNDMPVLEIGDEVKLLIQTAPVYLFSKYKEVFENQAQIKEDIIIMDDGMQNPSIIKDFQILVIDNDLKDGNGFLLPAGPLRESMQSAILKSDAIFNIEGKSIENLSIKQYKVEKKYSLENIQQNSDYLAFSGLAVNEKFFSSLINLGLNVAKTLEFEDHHNYSEDDIKNILEISKKNNLIPITTAKDLVKISDFYANKFCVLNMKFSMQNDLFCIDILQKMNKMNIYLDK